tara:strand:+ start:3710 stop:4015 length:306 start_codon:yes stop_codon:yes gene_type:complete
MWTCIECDGSYDSNSGDTDERTCNECIDKDSFIPINEEPKKQGIPIFAEFYDKQEQEEAYQYLYESLPKSGESRFMLVLFMGRLHSTAMLGYSNDKEKEGK